MKAIRMHEPTGIGGLVYEDAPDAKPGLCDVLVKVVACGITHNELDWPVWNCRAGHPRSSIIPGQEVSGVVAALGYGDGRVRDRRRGVRADRPAARRCGRRVRRGGGAQPGAEATDRGPRDGRVGATGRTDGVAVAVRPRQAREGTDGGHPRRGRRGRVDRRPARALGRGAGDRHRARPGADAGHRTRRRRVHRARRRPARGRGRPGRPGRGHDRRRRADAVGRLAAVRRHACHDQARARSRPSRDDIRRSCSCRSPTGRSWPSWPG